MKREKRHQDIIHMLRSAKEALTGAELAEACGVSRQVIVQDIAILKASNFNIISTNKGYILVDPPGRQRVLKVRHKDSQIADELYTIIEAGGRIRDVFVRHEMYGEIRADLSLSTRRDVDAFVKNLEEGKVTPLKKLTDGSHYHTIEAASDEVLDEIEKLLRDKEYLAES
jgi:hypothetical protein